MSGRFVRASKYRHVFGRSTRKEQCYDNLRISKNAWDTNLIKANPHYISVNWEASGGGAFAVIPINEKGRLPEQIPLFRGHTAVVLDTDWNPFDDSLIASGSDDGKAFIWRVPGNFSLHTDGEEPRDVAPVAKLTGHSRKVGHVLFNPAAENVLATSSGDYTIKLWDVEAGTAQLVLKHTDIVQSLSWSANGSLMVTTSRDKKLRIWDTRQQEPAHVVAGHAGAKNSRAVWMGEHDRVATTGFSKMSDRQLGLWDIKNPKEPVGGFQMLDSMSGVSMPFWDDSTQCLYLAGKGDGNIRYYEYENDRFEYLSEYKSGDPQRGIAFMPKRGVNVHENEVMRAFKSVNDSYIEPISFLVPRRAEVFQDDIFPPVVGLKPAMSSTEWFEGKEALPPKIDLASVYAGEEPAEIASVPKPSTKSPASSQIPSPTKKEPEPVRETPQPSSTFRGPPPSMREQTRSVADLATKFADKDDVDSSDGDDDTSSFEEVSKPVDRSGGGVPLASKKVEEIASPGLRDAAESGPPSSVGPSQQKSTALPMKDAPSSGTTSRASTFQPQQKQSNSTEKSTASPLAPTPPPSSGEPIQGYLHEIKSFLQQQNQTMAAQSEKIAQLTAEVDMLKQSLGDGVSGRDKDDRIRELEAQLERSRT